MLRIVLGVTLTLSVAAVAAEEKPADKTRGSYVHVVIFTMKKGTSTADVDVVIKDCRQMLGKIAAVRGVKAGRPAAQATPTYARKNYDLALVILVDDFAGLKSYLDDPLHVAFVKKHEAKFDMEKLEVFDFTDGR